MILVEREAEAVPSAAIAPTPDGWAVLRFVAFAGPVFLSPVSSVRADDRKRYANFDVAWRIARAEDAPPLAAWARA